MQEDEILEETNNESSPKTNEIIEINDDEQTQNYDFLEPTKNTEKKEKKKKESKWSKLSSKTRKIIIISIIVVSLIIISLIVYFVFFHKDNKQTVEPPKNDPVIVQKDNYNYIDGKLVFKNINGSSIGEYTCNNQNELNCYVAYYDNQDNFDEAHYIYEDNSKLLDRSDIISNRYVMIYDNAEDTDGNLILYDIKEQKSLGEFKLVKKYQDNAFILQDTSDNYGVVNLENEYEAVIPFKYQYLGYINNKESLIAMDKDNYYLIDNEGNKLTKALPGEVKTYDNKFISVLVNGNRLLYNYNSERVTADVYKLLSFEQGYVAAINKEGLTVYDKNMNPLYYDALKVYSSKQDDYNPTYTLDKSNVVIKSDYVYKLEFTTDTLTINYISLVSAKREENTKEININEGRINSKYAYVSYFDGKLYFYKDQDKLNLLGHPYECLNPNLTDSQSEAFNSCFLAKQTNIVSSKDTTTGYIPIYQNRYAFIQDGNEIKLYDLLQKDASKALKATYSAVDAGSYLQGDVITFLNDANAIIAKSFDSNKLGMIQINESGIKGLTDSFSYDSVVKVNDNYLLKNNQNYSLCLKENSNINCYKSSDSSKNYLMIKVDKVNKIYNYDLDLVTTNNLEYLKLYDDYFIGIDIAKKIKVYHYNGNAYNMAGDYTVILDDYEASYTLKEDKDTGKIIITVNGDDNTESYEFEVSLNEETP